MMRLTRAAPVVLTLSGEFATSGSQAADWQAPPATGSAARRQQESMASARGFQGIEFDNLDSWTRFDGTPVAGQVPFGRPETVA